MSLEIDVDKVASVLLADGWHDVTDKSFTLDSYEFLWWPPGLHKDQTEPQIVHGGGASGVCATGFQFKERVAAGVVSTHPANVLVSGPPDGRTGCADCRLAGAAGRSPAFIRAIHTSSIPATHPAYIRKRTSTL